MGMHPKKKTRWKRLFVQEAFLTNLLHTLTKDPTPPPLKREDVDLIVRRIA